MKTADWLKWCRFVSWLCLSLGSLKPIVGLFGPPYPHYEGVGLGHNYGFFRLQKLRQPNTETVERFWSIKIIPIAMIYQACILRIFHALCHLVLIQETPLSCVILFAAACCRQYLYCQPCLASGSIKAPQDFRSNCFLILNPCLLYSSIIKSTH